MEEKREIIKEIIDYQNYLKSEYGFDWDSVFGVIDKLEEEIKELKEALMSGKENKIEEEFGDILITVVNISRFLNLDILKTLKKSFNKFKDRFKKMEEIAKERKIDLKKLNINELDSLWEEAK
ncbi:MAG: hypothetical protein H5U37_01060 [Caldisericia bacterium]|nr:hypothetical protein [Caldisericia bacterium]